MSNGQSPQDQEHEKTLQELKRAKELADAEKGKLDAEKGKLEAQRELEAQKSRGAADEQKALIASETSKKQMADAEKDTIEAQRALERARKPPDAAVEALQMKAATAKAEKELAEAQKASADASKAEADASKARADADLAAFKARFGDVPTAQYKGDVNLKENAGKTEATLLAAQAVRSAAAAIVENINELETKPTKVTLLATPDVPAFDNLLRFNVEIGIVRKAFDNMDAASSDAKNKEPADDGGQRTVARMRAPGKQRAVPPAAAAGLALEAADKLLGFFRTDYTVGGIDVTVEDATLVNELAGLLTRNKYTVYLPKIFTSEVVQASEDLIGDLEQLAQRRTEGIAAVAEHEHLAKKWTDAGAQEADQKNKEEMTAAAEAHTHAADVAHNATALYDSWFTKLSSPDEKTSVVPIVAVIRERSMMDALSSGRSLLITHIHASGGSYYAKKNMWTVLGGMPFFHMGGTVASFALIDGESGVVAAAGTVPVHGGFVKATKLENEIATRPGPPASRSWWGRIFRTTTGSARAKSATPRTPAQPGP